MPRKSAAKASASDATDDTDETETKAAPKSAAPKKTAAKTQEIMCVRIKRYNPRKGHRLQRYSLWGIKFLEEQNWYKVPTKILFMGAVKNLKAYLEEVRQDNEDPDSPLAFDVVTVAEMERINRREREAEQLKQFNLRRTGDPVDFTRSGRIASEAGDLTLDDVNNKPDRRKFPRSTRPARRDEIDT